MIVTRFAPSPTGEMHVGNLRTALFNFLLAKQGTTGGKFILRIEDTDQERSKPEYAKSLLNDMKIMGLDWDEIYYQSQRGQVYAKYYKKLEEMELAYPCFCSEEKLKFIRKSQLNRGQPPRYPGTCRSLTATEIAAKLAAGLKPTLRFKLARDQTIEFTDLIKGTLKFNSNDIGDFIIRRNNGTGSFMFCNAIDDATMGVTHALRGDDHVTNSPRQILILEALGLSPPQYGHFAMILGDDSLPLSKRNGSCSVGEILQTGYEPLAVNNYLARLGHSYSDNVFYNLAALGENFTLANVTKSAARYDAMQLANWQQQFILHTDNLAELIAPSIGNLVPDSDRVLFAQAIQKNIVFPQDAVRWAKAFYLEPAEIPAAITTIMKNAGTDYFVEAIKYYDNINQLKKTTGLKGKNLFMPLRVALTYTTTGPELPNIIKLLGAERVCQRLQRALNVTTA